MAPTPSDLQWFGQDQAGTPLLAIPGVGIYAWHPGSMPCPTCQGTEFLVTEKIITCKSCMPDHETRPEIIGNLIGYYDAASGRMTFASDYKRARSRSAWMEYGPKSFGIALRPTVRVKRPKPAGRPELPGQTRMAFIKKESHGDQAKADPRPDPSPDESRGQAADHT